jgi:hypothetical protein
MAPDLGPWFLNVVEHFWDSLFKKLKSLTLCKLARPLSLGSREGSQLTQTQKRRQENKKRQL